MAITGKFAADFASFYDACAKAEVSLRSFDDGAGKVEKSLNRMVDSFSGRKLIQDATQMAEAVERIGGPAKLTEAELARISATATEAAAKMKAMGIEVPPGIQKIADATRQAEEGTTGWASAANTMKGALAAVGIVASVDAVVRFTKAIFDDADAMMRLHDMTGISIEALQALRAAGDDSGVALDTMTSAVTMLQKRLGGDDKSAAAAMRDLGLSVDEFSRLDGAGQLQAVAQAIQNIHDPLRVANDLSGLFGKQWADLLPVLKTGMADTAAGMDQMSASTVKALDDAGDKVGKFYRIVKAQLGEAVADVLTGTTAAFRKFQGSVEEVTQLATKGVESLGPWKDALHVVTPEIEGMANAEKIAAELTASATAAIQKQTAATKEAEQQLQRLKDLTAHLLGQDDIKRANEYMNAIKATGEVSKLTADRQAEIHAAVSKALDAYHAMGELAPMEMFRVWDATNTVGDGLKTLIEIGDRVNDHLIPPPMVERVKQFKEDLEGIVIIGKNLPGGAVTAFTGPGQPGGVTPEVPSFGQKPVLPTGWSNGGAILSAADFAGYSASLTGPFSGQTGLLYDANRGRANSAVTIQIDASNSFYDTPEAVSRLATKVGDALTQRLSSIGAGF